METPAEFVRRDADSRQCFFEGLHEPGGVVGAPVREGRPHLVPHALVRVEFGCVRGEGFEAEAPLTTQESPYGLSLVTAAVVEDHDDEAPKVPHEMAEERGHLDVVEVFARQAPEVQADPVVPGADRKCRNDRNPLALLVVVEDWGVPSHGPGAAHGRYQEEAAFVEEDNVGAQVLGVFFIRGHSSLFHRAMRSSSRSNARRSGFWQLKPIPRRIRPTWSRSYLTPNVLSMTSAIREVVHSSVWYPCAIAPLSSIRASVLFCRRLRRGGRPGDARTSYTRSFSLRRRSRQRITELGAQPTRRATSLRDSPSSRRFNARLRRSAIKSGEPLGRILASIEETSVLRSLCRSQ